MLVVSTRQSCSSVAGAGETLTRAQESGEQLLPSSVPEEVDRFETRGGEAEGRETSAIVSGFAITQLLSKSVEALV